ncbi:hypothetical protein MP213Fo_14670 [Pseudochrobactrum sp. MP213Fo]
MLAMSLINSLTYAAQLGLLAISLSLVYSVLKLPNFAQGELAIVAGYSAYALIHGLGMPLLVAALIAIPIAGFAGIVMDKMVFRHLRTASVLTLMIVSFGISIIMQNGSQAIFGPNNLNLENRLPKIFVWGPIRITDVQIAIIAIAAATVIAMHFLLFYTKLGRSIRAVSADPSLASARGINSNRTILHVWFISGCIAGICGILFTLELGVRPTAGSELMLAAFAAVTLGGVGGMYGALLGALLISLAENLLLSINFAPLFKTLGLVGEDTYFLAIPTGYKMAIMFTILMVTLYLQARPLRGRFKPFSRKNAVRKKTGDATWNT